MLKRHASRVSDGNGDGNGDGHGDGRGTESELAELDALATEWVGNDLSRWHWWEARKEEHRRLVAALRRNEAEAAENVRELRSTLEDIERLTGWRTLDAERRITSIGWVLVLGSVTVPLLLTAATVVWLQRLVADSVWWSGWP